MLSLIVGGCTATGNSTEVDGTTSTSYNVEASVTIENSVILEYVEGEGTTTTTQILESGV